MSELTVILPQARDDLGREIGRSIEEALRQAGVAQQAAREATANARARMQEAQQGTGGTDVAAAISLMQSQVNAMNQEIAELTRQLTPSLSRAREEAIREQINSAIERRDDLRESMDHLMTAGTPGIVAPPVIAAEDMIPPQAVDITIAFLITCAVIAIGIPIARAWGRWLDRRGQRPAPSPETNQRLTQIEQAIEAVAIEVERVSEGQRFTNKVIGEMRGIAAPAQGWPLAGAREAAKAEKEPV